MIRRRLIVDTPPQQEPQRARPEVSIAMVLDAAPASLSALTADELEEYRRKRALLLKHELQIPEFDPRHVLKLEGKELEAWSLRRLQWARRVLR
jgi:hypothetical protein